MSRASSVSVTGTLLTSSISTVCTAALVLDSSVARRRRRRLKGISTWMLQLSSAQFSSAQGEGEGEGLAMSMSTAEH